MYIYIIKKLLKETQVSKLFREIYRTHPCYCNCSVISIHQAIPIISTRHYLLTRRQMLATRDAFTFKSVSMTTASVYDPLPRQTLVSR